jgi:hypothetical protein
VGLYSGWAALGLAAEGKNPAAVAKNGHSLIEYLRSGVRLDTDPGSLERTILAAVAAGADPRSFGGRNLVGALRSRVGRNGSVSEQTNLTAFAVLALRAAGAGVSGRTLHWLLAQQDRDGGFNFGTAGGTSDIDDTGAVLEAISRGSIRLADHARRRAVAFIRRHQDRDGGFPASPGGGSNAQSTAWAIQGLLSVGVSPATIRRGGAPSPLAYLESLIAPDGHVRYARSSNQTPVWVTAQAAMALAGKTLPLAPVPMRPAHRSRHAASSAPGGASTSARQASRPKSRGSRRLRTSRRAVDKVAPGVPARLVTDAGILDALVLAPVGLG